MPPVMLKRVDGGFVDPVQDTASQRGQREHDRASRGFANTRTAVEDYYSHASKKGKLAFFQRTHPYTQLQRLAEATRLDPQRGHFKTPGIDRELHDFLQADFNEFATFADYFAALHRQLGFQTDFQLAQTLVHSVALQLAPGLADQARGIILARGLESFTSGQLQPDGTPLTTDALAGKVALRLVHAKVRAIVAGKQRGSSYERAGLLDFFLRDSYVPRPSSEVVQWLREQVYPDSIGSAPDSLRRTGFGEDFADRLQRNYFEAKAAAVCRFLGLDERAVLRIDGDADHFALGELFSRPRESHQGQAGDQGSEERRLMSVELKALLAHKDVVRTLDAKIAKLEQALRLYDSRPPVADRVSQQLDLLLHALPSKLRARFLGEAPNSPTAFEPRYLGRSFNNLQLQWRAIDLDFPAEIMPVEEYREHQRTLQNVEMLVPPGSYYKERLVEMKSLLQVERVTESGEDDEIDRQRRPQVPSDPEGAKLAVVTKGLGERELQTIERTVESVSVRHNGKMPIAEARLQQQKRRAAAASKKTVDEKKVGLMPLRQVARALFLTRSERRDAYPMGERGRDDDEAEAAGLAAKDAPKPGSREAKKRRRLERLKKADAERASVAFLDLHRRGRIDVFAQRSRAQAVKTINRDGVPFVFPKGYKRGVRMTNERLLNRLMANTSEHQEHFSVVGELENAREDDLETQFDRLPPGEKKSVTLFRELRRPVYFKHYVAQAFREFYAHNPYDHAHFVDDALNPNLGFYLGSPIDPNSLAVDQAGRGDSYGLRSFRPRVSAVAPLSREVIARSAPRLHAFGRGKRKSSEAFAVVTSPGTGRVTVNNREFIEYFGLDGSRYEILTPLIMADRTCRVDLKLFVSGGGVNGQATACTVAVAKALVKAFPELQQPFYNSYMLWTDARQVERKKTGKYKARKSYTYVRR